MKQMKVSIKLTLGFLTIIVILLFVGSREYLVLNKIHEKETVMIKCGNLNDAIMESKYVLGSDMQILMELLAAKNIDQFNEYWQKHVANIDSFDNYIKSLKQLTGDNTWGTKYSIQKVAIGNIADKVDGIHNDNIVPAFENIKSLRIQLFNTKDYSLRADILSQLDKIDHNTDKVIETQHETLVKLEMSIEKIVDDAKLDMNKASSNAKTEAMIIIAFAIVFSILIARYITNDITKQLGCEPSEAAKIANMLAYGDLSYKFNEGKKMGLYNDLENMVRKLKDIVTNIISGAENIAAASQQMSSTSQQMSQGATEQASSNEEVSASMEQMTGNIQQNTDNAQQTVIP